MLAAPIRNLLAAVRFRLVDQKQESNVERFWT